jgi:outer membrane immunogenic protein
MFRSIVLAGAAVLAAGTAAQAADLIIPTTPVAIYESAGFSWEGLYAGVRGGFASYGDNGAAQVGFGQIGGVVGVNFMPADPILLGLEISGDYYWNNATSGSTFFANVKAGAVVTDSALIYAIAGVGVDNSAGVSTGMYQVGGGIEFAVTDAVTVRGEVVGQGDFTAGAGDNFLEGAQATVGVFYHF